MTNTTLQEDISTLASSEIFESLKANTVLVAGATGLIGSILVQAALTWNRTHNNPAENICVIALARNESKAKALFDGYSKEDGLDLVIGDVTCLPAFDKNIDWIVHGASITSSAAFAKQPAEVSLNEILATRSLLELARTNDVKGMVYLSSLEVYGSIPEGTGPVDESYDGSFNHLMPRNSYPAAKQMCENLCASYASEYRTSVKIARLAQTFGAGVSPDDKRVFAYFARAVIAGKPIVLHTPGKGERCYCYTTDAICGLLEILVHGKAGEAYNVSNSDTFCSVREMAEMLIQDFGEAGTELIFDTPENLSQFGFAPESHVELSSKKLQALGWKPQLNLHEMYEKLIKSMKSDLDNQESAS